MENEFQRIDRASDVLATNNLPNLYLTASLSDEGEAKPQGIPPLSGLYNIFSISESLNDSDCTSIYTLDLGAITYIESLEDIVNFGETCNKDAVKEGGLTAFAWDYFHLQQHEPNDIAKEDIVLSECQDVEGNDQAHDDAEDGLLCRCFIPLFRRLKALFS